MPVAPARRRRTAGEMPRLLNPKGNLTWGSQISNFFTDGKTVYALCDRMFIGDDGRRVKDLEASSYHFLPLQLDPATGEARLMFLPFRHSPGL